MCFLSFFLLLTYFPEEEGKSYEIDRRLKKILTPWKYSIWKKCANFILGPKVRMWMLWDTPVSFGSTLIDTPRKNVLTAI